MHSDSTNWSGTLDLLAHELRSPVSVIGGYARMLSEGRLTGEDRDKALVRIEHAAGAISAISRQSAELARWLSVDEPPHISTSFADIVDRAISTSAAASRATRETAGAAKRQVLCHDAHALSAAVAALLDVVAHGNTDELLVLAPDAAEARLVAGPRPLEAQLRGTTPADDPGLLRDSRGVHMDFAVALAVVAAHGGRVWRVDGQRSALGLSLPAAPAPARA